jgi:hypothetical protein
MRECRRLAAIQNALANARRNLAADPSSKFDVRDAVIAFTPTRRTCPRGHRGVRLIVNEQVHRSIESSGTLRFDLDEHRSKEDVARAAEEVARRVRERLGRRRCWCADVGTAVFV